MNKSLMIDILKADRCNNAEAIKMIDKNRVVIYENPAEYIDNLKASNCYDNQTIDDIRKGKYSGQVNMIMLNDHEYLIEYL